MREPDFEVDGKALRLWSGDCVYAWRRGEEWLYVGSSSRGLSRPLNHSVINVIEDIQDSDTLQAWFFEPDTPSLDSIYRTGLPEFLRFEAEMIKRHKPKHNVTDNPARQPRLSRKQIANLEREKRHAERRREIEDDQLGWSDQKGWD